MIIAKIGNEFPKTCNKCPLFVEGEIGCPSYCILGCEYTDDEIDSIDSEEDANLIMYYHGCLPHRPINCPLIEMKKEV